MRNDSMKKVGELLEMAGIDKEIVKSITEKLADETVSEEAIKHEEAGRGTEDAPVDGAINKGGIKPENVEAEDEEKAEVDPKTNVGGYNPVTEGEEMEIKEALGELLALVQEAYNETAQLRADHETLKEEYAKLVADKIIEESATEEVSEDQISEL